MACADLGLDLPDVRTSSFAPGDAGAAVEAWVRSGVTGVCAFNDELAMALIEAAHRQGLAIPGDLGIVGVDNLPWGAQSVPSLSTVAPNPEQIGRVIAEYVVAGVSGSTARPERVSSSFISLIERESA